MASTEKKKKKSLIQQMAEAGEEHQHWGKVHNWTVENTVDWLIRSCELPQYVESFRKHNVTGAKVPLIAVGGTFLSKVVGITDPIHQSKITIKAMEVMEALNSQFNSNFDSQFNEHFGSHKETDDQRRTRLDETKRELRENFEKSGIKDEQRRREERLREVERETASNQLKERLASTWYNLELNSTAHELDQWCVECGCIHTSDVVNDN